MYNIRDYTYFMWQGHLRRAEAPQVSDLRIDAKLDQLKLWRLEHHLDTKKNIEFARASLKLWRFEHHLDTQTTLNLQGHPSFFGLLKIILTPKQTLNSQGHPSNFGLLNIIATLTKYWIGKGTHHFC